MPLSTHNITAPLSTPRALGLTHVHTTFDTLKRHAHIAFAQHAASHRSTTLPDTAVSQLDRPDFEDGERTSTRHISGTATAASVGLGYAYKVPPTRVWLLPYFHYHLCIRPAPPASPLSYYSDFDVDIEAILGDEDPQSTAPNPSSRPPYDYSPFSAGSVHDASRPCGATAYAATPESPSSSVASTPYASSLSADSDSSFEAISPITDNIRIPEPLKARSPSTEGERLGLPDFPPSLSKRLEAKTGSSEIEARVQELVNCLDEEAARRCAQPQVAQPSGVPDPDRTYLAVASEVCPNDERAGETNLEATEDESEAEGYEDSDEDDEPLSVIYNPHTGNMYRLGRVLGTGGFSKVVLATDLEGREYAAKIISKQKVFRRPDGRQNLLHEKNIMAKITQLNTPRVVQLIECWEREHEVYFIMVSIFAART